jgi:copper(I)-binding protein
MIRHTAIALLLTIVATTATAADHHHTGMPGGSAVTVDKAWARASIGKNGAAYFTLTNTGKSDNKLVGVSSDVARRVELHTHKMDGNIMRMRALENIIVPAGESVTLKPGGHHVMLMGLTRKLKEGDSFPLTVIFAKAGQMRISVKVGKMGAAGPMGGMKPVGGHGGHKMKH